MTVTVNGHVCTLADNVKETTTTTGAGTYQLNGAVSGFAGFSIIGNGNKTLYRAQLATSWEIGVGTYATGSPPTLARTAILKSSNSDNAVSWTAGAKEIFVVAPAALLDQIGSAAGLPGSDTITNTILSNMPAWTFKIRNAGTTGDPSDAAAANITTDVVAAAGDFLLGFLASGEIRKWTVESIQPDPPVIPTAIASTKVTVFTSSGTFNKDAKCVEAEIHCTGAGGGGGGAPISGASNAAEGAGGGGGAYSYIRLAAATMASSVTVTVGQGGAGGGGAANGAAGTGTSFGAHCVADGAAGGTQGTATSGNNFIASAIGGEQADGTGTVRLPGGFSGCGRVISSNGGVAVWVGANYGGMGAGPWGGPIVGGTTASDGATGRLYGGGGAGAHSQNSAAGTGGNGADGICVVIERLSP